MADHYKLMNKVDWGTPKPIVDAAYAYLAGIDLDPASSTERNRVVGATRILGLADVDKEIGIPCDWGCATKIFINPPGGKFGKHTLVSLFWQALAAQCAEYPTTSFVWVAYNVNQLQTLQQVDPKLLARCDVCIPSSRVSYLDEAAQPVNGTPSASAILGRNFADHDGSSFAGCFSSIGKVWRA